MSGSSSRPGSGRGNRSGPVRLKVHRLRRDRLASGPITASEEVSWALALEYAAAVDLAKLNGNARELLAAGKVLEGTLARLTAPPTPPRGGSPGDGGDSGSAELYGRPPTVGDAADA